MDSGLHAKAIFLIQDGYVGLIHMTEGRPSHNAWETTVFDFLVQDFCCTARLVLGRPSVYE